MVTWVILWLGVTGGWGLLGETGQRRKFLSKWDVPKESWSTALTNDTVLFALRHNCDFSLLICVKRYSSLVCIQLLFCFCISCIQVVNAGLGIAQVASVLPKTVPPSRKHLVQAHVSLRMGILFLKKGKNITHSNQMSPSTNCTYRPSLRKGTVGHRKLQQRCMLLSSSTFHGTLGAISLWKLHMFKCV